MTEEEARQALHLAIDKRGLPEEEYRDQLQKASDAWIATLPPEQQALL